MKKIICLIAMALVNVSACANKKDEKLHILKHCSSNIDAKVITGSLLDDLFICKRDNEAFQIIKEQEHIFTSQDYAVTGDVLLMHNYVDKAKYYLNIAANQGDGEAMQRLGAIYAYKDNDINKALNLLIKSLAHDYFYAYITLADIYLEDEKYKDNEQAIFYANKAIESGYYEGIYYLAKAQANDKKYSEAEVNLKKLTNYNLNELSRLGFAELYYSFKDYKGYNPSSAKKILEQLLKTSESPDRLRWMAEFYMGDHEYQNKEKAHQYFKLAFEEGDLLSERFLLKSEH